MEEEINEPTEEGTDNQSISEEKAQELLSEVKRITKQTNEGEEIFFVQDLQTGRKIELHSRLLSIEQLMNLGWTTWINFFPNNNKGENKTYYG